MLEMNNVKLIWAQTSNGVIGKDNALMFKIQEDMRRFRTLTTECVVIMGRKTWESLPAAYKPLPGRYNVILTHDKYYRFDHPEVEVIHDLEAFLHLHKDKRIWIIGGGSVYQQAMPYAKEIHVTEAMVTMEGDTHIPFMPPTHFNKSFQSLLKFDALSGLKYRFITYTRVRKLHFGKTP